MGPVSTSLVDNIAQPIACVFQTTHSPTSRNALRWLRGPGPPDVGDCGSTTVQEGTTHARMIHAAGTEESQEGFETRAARLAGDGVYTTGHRARLSR